MLVSGRVVDVYVKLVGKYNIQLTYIHILWGTASDTHEFRACMKEPRISKVTTHQIKKCCLGFQEDMLHDEI